jgi:serine phosphatase RsbU (regulator of sigma subunit)/tetratricopeptide (TPR) repeat protein
MNLIIRISAFLCCFTAFFCFSQNTLNVDSLLEITISKNNHDTIRLTAYIKLVDYYRKKEPETAQKYLDTVFVLTNNSEYYKITGSAFNYKGMMHYSFNQFDSAFKAYDNSILNFKKASDYVGLAKVLCNKANVYAAYDNYEQANKHYILASRFFESNNQQDYAALISINIGAIFHDTGNFKEAIKYYKKALAVLINKPEHADNLSLVYTSLADISITLKKYDDALKYLEQSADYNLQTGNELNNAKTIELKGRLHLEKNENKEAKACFEKMIEIYTKLNLEAKLVDAYKGLCVAEGKDGNLTKAQEYLDKTRVIAEKSGNLTQLKDLLYHLSYLYYKKGEYKKAFDSRLEFERMKDSIQKIQNIKSVSDMQAHYESDKKQAEIELLQKNNKLNEYEIKQNKYNFYAATVGLVIALLVSFFSFKAYSVNKKKNKLLNLQNSEIQEQKLIIEEKNKDITDSIKYAKRIQEAILIPENEIRSFLPESFILFKPKDIVSGDFYWIEELNQIQVFAVADCTGHGVPGAFMSIVGHNLLTQAIREKNISSPSKILDFVNEGLNQTLRQTYEDSKVKDGMDISLCAISSSGRDCVSLQWAGANNPLWIFYSEENTYRFEEIKADKQPVGSFVGEKINPFTIHQRELKKGDIIYIFSDGYADQFGGKEGKKYKSKNLKQFILDIAHLPMDKQKEMLEANINTWKQDREQIDDICIMGIRV